MRIIYIHVRLQDLQSVLVEELKLHQHLRLDCLQTKLDIQQVAI